MPQLYKHKVGGWRIVYKLHFPAHQPKQPRRVAHPTIFKVLSVSGSVAKRITLPKIQTKVLDTVAPAQSTKKKQRPQKGD